MTMGDILTKHGSDKDSWHKYGSVYDGLFPNRDSVTAVLELGIAYGASVVAWREIFPNAVIVGLDVDPCVPCPRLDRMEMRQGCQTDRNTLATIVGSRNYDLIIDDASHKISDQLVSLFFLWPYLKEGGYYVIEEFDIQDGTGPMTHLESYGLFKGIQLHTTPSPNGDELLVVIRK